ncbi:MAG: hypothetical protein CL912_30750 [Deltaproteobacteria bacterium]|nr:hypothetical protein [Deltaproteobacteria bacterium]
MDTNNLYIFSANFGGQDITSNVKDLVSNNKTINFDTNMSIDTFGDPWPDHLKALMILYQFGSRPMELLIASEITGTIVIDPDVAVDSARTKFLFYDSPIAAVIWGIMDGQEGPGDSTKLQAIATTKVFEATSDWLGFDGWPNVEKACVVFVRSDDSFQCFSAREGSTGTVA